MPQVNEKTTGSAYWRSLEEYAQTPEVQELLKQEFAGYNPDDVLKVSRRRFVQLMAASMSLAGLTLSGCRRWPKEQLAPFAARPVGRVPGVPTSYASIVERGGVANGVLVTSFDGRPIKLEGNPLHPGSLGATDAFTQADILQMYDPYRLRQIARGRGDMDGAKPTWDDFLKYAREQGQALKDNPGSFAVLAEPSSNESLKRMKQRLLAQYPGLRWYEYAPVNRDNEIKGSIQAFGKPVRPQYHLDKADVIVCFDSDILGDHPNKVRHARDWSKGRKSADEGKMSRLYAAESAMSITGSVADHRLPVRSAKIGAMVQGVAQMLDIMPGNASLNGESEFVAAIVKDLKAHRGTSLVVAGANQPPEVHALCWAINDALGNVGKTIGVTVEPVSTGGSGGGCFQDIAELAGEIGSGTITHLLILGGNPVYDAPADLDLPGKFDKLGSAIHLTEYRNETSLKCDWQLPKAHYLECWGDGRAWDGTLGIQQPLILPIARKGAASKSPAELLAMLLGEQATDGYTIVRETMSQFLPSVGFSSAWREALHTGVVKDSAYKTTTDRPRQGNTLAAPPLAGDEGFEVTFVTDQSVYDGRYSDIGWLQEAPDPMTKLTWDNAALINIADANKAGIKEGDLVNLTLDGTTLEIAAYLMPGQARGSIALALGYGRSVAGPVGTGVGFNTYKLRTSRRPGIARGASIAKVGKHYDLALTQNHHLIDQTTGKLPFGPNIGDELSDTRVGPKGQSGMIIKEGTFENYKHDPKHAFAAPGEHGETVRLQLWDEPYTTPAKREGGPTAFNEPHAWGMTVDMNACIGCNACVLACQAENNVPVVGKNMVMVSREMQWIRIDRYFKNDRKTDPAAENPEVVFQPMLCQQCENAPCEQVCPVAATVHDAEGLNVMVYNRCIGTRYCSNNCPYKVRRFNYFDFHAKDPRGSAKPWLLLPDMQQDATIGRIKRMVYNPDVTVRMRGVMEKCSYCVQRIKRQTIAAKNEWARGERDKPTVDDGSIVTACQQSCPTEAIVFGNLNDADSQVTKSQQNPRAYMLLEELNVRARNRYLAKLRNPSV